MHLNCDKPMLHHRGLWVLGLLIWIAGLCGRLHWKNEQLNTLTQQFRRVQQQVIALPKVDESPKFQHRLNRASRASPAIKHNLSELQLLAKLKNPGVRLNQIHWKPKHWTLLGVAKTSAHLTIFLQHLKENPPFNASITTSIYRHLPTDSTEASFVYFTVHCGSGT